ncbi:MAG: GTPase Era [Alphaproteobacteria bacterium]
MADGQDTPAGAAPKDAAGPKTRCGFIALVGSPNAGKSTLLNRLIGTKISIVTPKIQTTRSRITGIAIEGVAQMIYIDTPGIFAPRRRLDRAMVAAAWSGMADADVAVVLVDAKASTGKRGVDKDTQSIVEGLRKQRRLAVLAVNKIDLVPHPALLGLAAALNDDGVFTETFMISALSGDGVDDLKAHLHDNLAEGPWLYPEDQISDIPMRMLAAEITREQAFLQLHQELPYAVAVETESWEEHDDGSVRIGQVITVRRDSQKAMVLGKGGSRIKSIGATARAELERLMERKVHLFIHVRVRANWMERPEHYRALGLDFDA